MTRSRPLVVIGGGPAGMAAAIEAARAGLSPTLIDESPRLGGQIYRQPPQAFRFKSTHALGKDFVRGERLRAEFDEVADRVELLSGASVLGVWGGREIMWASDEASDMIHAEQIIIATGAYERPAPFPGWTLPGVMTAGGVQTLIKTMCVRPGRRSLVVGSGPLLLVVANQLSKVGVEVVAVLEAGKLSWSPRPLLKVWGEWELLKDAWGYWRGLRRAGIPLLFNHTIFEARGRAEVEEASYGPVDPDTWRPLKHRMRTMDVDLVVTGFGFVPNTELTELVGCRHEYVHKIGGWIPVRDVMMRTTVPGVFAAGDGAGVAGALVAVEEGRVAGVTAAEQAGAISAGGAAKRREAPLARLRSLGRVREVLDEVSWIRQGLLELATPETLVCRCEEVTLAKVNAALGEGARDLQAVKLLTRLGMGPCQGRNCAPSMGMYICHTTGRTPENVGRINPRPPVRPATLGALAQMEAAAEAASDPPRYVNRGA
jgi:NADPH-dependent 2,4-dienoyl-CoA reductase/sulfur reductase-like enzyme